MRSRFSPGPLEGTQRCQNLNLRLSASEAERGYISAAPRYRLVAISCSSPRRLIEPPTAYPASTIAISPSLKAYVSGQFHTGVGLRHHGNQ